MMDVFIWAVVFVISLFILIKASDYFTEAAEKIGLYFGLPSFIVGVTIVAFGTSLPEIISSLFAVFGGTSEIVVGNVVGSNIANILLVLGVSAIIGKKLKVTYSLLSVDLPILVSSAFLFAVMIWDGKFSIVEAIISLIGLIIYLTYAVRSEKKEGKKATKVKLEVKKEPLGIKVWGVLLLSGLFIFIGAKYTIESVVELSTILQIGTEIIAVTAVALGTSLPELIVSVTAARKGKGGIAIGNVLGSNIFNVFAVMGIPALFSSLVIPAGILSFSLPVMIIATLLYFFMTQEKEITIWEGWFLILFYVFFIGSIFGLV